ncbi:hypothetical protein [Aeoliella sp.]|uniref:hypothetical protein n=1 Tax=Aeoliella sp. TaxID=2795800 RepID=UPI003CCC1612
MLLASFQSDLGVFMIMMVVAAYGWALLIKKLMGVNPEVKDMAKKAAAQQAMKFLAKWLK